MAPNRFGSNLLGRIANDREVLACGLSVEIAGLRSVKVISNGIFQGLWRQAIGSFDWYPAGYNQPVLRVPTAEAVIRHIVRSALPHGRDAMS